MTGRTFTASLKPAWTVEQIEQFTASLTGTALVYGINHDKDSDAETGETIPEHTHILIEYETPRKISTVANLLKVESNFIELVKSKKSMLRYLIHLDDPDKYQYSPDEVIHNNTVSYSDLLMGQSLSDKEIAQYIMDGKGLDLLGVVSASKLRTIQSYVHFNVAKSTNSAVYEMKEQIGRMEAVISSIGVVVHDWNIGLMKSAEEIQAGFKRISMSIDSLNPRRKR